MNGRSGQEATASNDAMRPYRLRAIRIGVQASFLVLCGMTMYPLLPGSRVDDNRAFAVILALGALGSLIAAVLPWRRLFARGWGQRALHVWSMLDIVIVSAAVAVTGHEQSSMYLLYVPIVVFYAASYPVRSQAVLSAFCLAAYVLVLRTGPPIDAGTLFFRVVVTASVFFIASFLARELAAQTRQHGRARDEAERRASLLAVVAAAAREMHARSAPEVLDAVADAVLALGFDAGGIAVQVPGEANYVVVQARGALPPGETWWPVVATDAAPGSVVVQSDASPNGSLAPLPQRIAIPIRARIERPAVLLAGSHRRERFGLVDREALELLASRAARALESAEHAAALARSERRFRSLVQNTSDLITVIDADGVITYQSASSQDVLGRAPSTLAGRPLAAIVHPDDVVALGAALRRASGGEAPGTVEVRMRDGTGGWRHVEARVTDLRGDPAVGGVVLNGRDVTERHRLIDQLAYQALHDDLTGLPNRTLVHDRLAAALDAARPRARSIAVLFIDLDDFKARNDLFGHPVGDALLIEIGRRFAEALPPGATLGRFGGDEFAVVVDDVESARAAEAVAERLLESLAAPLCAGEADVHISASIGIAVGRGGELDADELLRRADIAMYAAKATGTGRLAVFDTAMESALLARHDLERDLRAAVERDEFELHFQPVIALETGRVHGVESLVRWRHPERGLLPPIAFIPLAEETALIVPLGRQVLRASCRQLADWRRRHSLLAPLRMSVNVSTQQLLDTGFPDDVAATLVEFGVPASSIVLEITEATLAEQQDTIADALLRLKRLGVGVAIDDFGTGYSSLGYLGTFPVDTLKIDRSFVSRIGAGDDAETLVGAVIDLANRLRLSIVAEGIERPAQFEFLRALGCRLGQGFLFSRPFPAADIEPLLVDGIDRALAARGRGGAGARARGAWTRVRDPGRPNKRRTNFPNVPDRSAVCARARRIDAESAIRSWTRARTPRHAMRAER